MDRIYSFPDTAKHFHCFTDVDDIKQHPDYVAAKSGEHEPAYRLVSEIASQFLQSLEGEFPEGSYFVSPFAQEAGGDNAIPLLLSLMAAEQLNGVSETDIVQLQRVFHTGADPMERLLLRPSFEGTVERGGNYVLVDDVTSMGGTLAELANYLRLNGGNVLGSIVLVNAGRDKNFKPVKKHIKLLEERFNEQIEQQFGIKTSALTANEASYLIGFRTIDEIRNRCLKAEKEIHLRLLSKGIR